MGTTADKLQHLADTKELIKTAIQGKGQSFSGTETFSDYATKIGNISNECNATPAHILNGITAYSGGGKMTGTIPLKTAQTFSPSTSTQTITAGQYLSGTQTINPVVGTAYTGVVVDGYTFNSSSGVNLSGTMPNRGAIASTITTQGGQYTVPQGYHWGTGKVTASFANLSAGNIKSGVNVGGVVGTLSAVQNRTINITNPYSITAWRFCVWGGNSILVNINNSSMSAIPSTINTYGDILVLYTYVFDSGNCHFFGISSGATELSREWCYAGNAGVIVQVIKLTSSTVSLVVSRTTY